ncbi:MAG: hypothetical protein PHO37_04215 [Kiritimatiellae bacterium]|nr:hypothetical protein [Kiritimatiellia bacterium]
MSNIRSQGAPFTSFVASFVASSAGSRPPPYSFGLTIARLARA